CPQGVGRDAACRAAAGRVPVSRAQAGRRQAGRYGVENGPCRGRAARRRSPSQTQRPEWLARAVAARARG
ncbi:hypothetical protein, partial [Bordetella genomosp. 5]